MSAAHLGSERVSLDASEFSSTLLIISRLVGLQITVQIFYMKLNGPVTARFEALISRAKCEAASSTETEVMGVCVLSTRILFPVTIKPQFWGSDFD